ncbi:hypothetical protein CYFUS_009144 [Cystobacter fuscus]|uniref:Uncharacterized protein n=1 Tax=Cystobacter fuscus TaxID=43 RepID=A0A250JIE4_9BACT|nr:hypothetical protein CYFUS_009144 [Cystobacter fuscus]
MLKLLRNGQLYKNTPFHVLGGMGAVWRERAGAEG